MSAEVAPKKRGRPKKVVPAAQEQGKNSLVEEAAPIAPSSSKAKARSVTAKAATGAKKSSSSTSKTPAGLVDEAPPADSVTEVRESHVESPSEVKPSIVTKKKATRVAARPVVADAGEKLAKEAIPPQQDPSGGPTPTTQVSEILRRADAFVRDSKVLTQAFSHLLQSREDEHARLEQKANLPNNTSRPENPIDGFPPSSVTSTPAQVPGSALPQSTSQSEQQLHSPSYTSHPQPASSMSFHQPPIDLTYRPKYTLPYSTTTALKARTASQSQRPSLRTAPPPSQPQPNNTGGRLPPNPSETGASQLESDVRYRKRARGLKSKYVSLVLALPIMIATSWFLLKKVHEEREYRAGRFPGGKNDPTGVAQLREATQVKQLEQDLARTVGQVDEKIKTLEGKAAVVKDHVVKVKAVGVTEREQTQAPMSVPAPVPAPVQNGKKRLLEE